ncbi:MAG TPA: hypothetical protein EYP17_12945 [Candidatus Latescibacteria bacterium]|nr:hypothetical protein [Candidatus Latescibacterota bacterium]
MKFGDLGDRLTASRILWIGMLAPEFMVDVYRDSTRELPLKEFVALAKDIGYRGVELRRTQVSPDTPLEEVEKIRRTVERARLEVTCITAREVFLEDRESFELFRRYVDLARALGCGLIVPWLRRAADYGKVFSSTRDSPIGRGFRARRGSEPSVFRGLRQIGYGGWVSLVGPKREGVDGGELARMFYEMLSRVTSS